VRKELGLLAIVGCVLACSGERVAPEPSGIEREPTGVAPPAGAATSTLSASHGAPSSAAPASVDELKLALAPRLSRSVAGLETVSHPSGVRLIRLKGRFGTAAVVRTRADGTQEQGCFDDAERAARFLAEGRGRP
jgi:hypothetical protein